MHIAEQLTLSFLKYYRIREQYLALPPGQKNIVKKECERAALEAEKHINTHIDERIKKVLKKEKVKKPPVEEKPPAVNTPDKENKQGIDLFK